MKLCSRKRRPHPGARAVILLEVVMALGLFVAAAAVFAVCMNASMSSLERQALNLHAENLAASVLAEVQMGARASAPGTVELDPSYQGWSAEIAAGPAQNDLLETGPTLSQVEVIVRHTNGVIVRRLAQSMSLAVPEQGMLGEGDTAADSLFP